MGDATLTRKHNFPRAPFHLRADARRPFEETGHPYSGLFATYEDRGEVSAFGTALPKLVSSQPPGAEAHIVDPL